MPLIDVKNQDEQFTARMPAELLESAAHHARATDRTLAAVVRLALRQYLESVAGRPASPRRARRS